METRHKKYEASGVKFSSQLWITCQITAPQCRRRFLRAQLTTVDHPAKSQLPVQAQVPQAQLRKGAEGLSPKFPAERLLLRRAWQLQQGVWVSMASEPHLGTMRGLEFINCTQQTPQGPFLVFLTKKHQPLLLKGDKEYVCLIFTPVSAKSALREYVNL